MYEKEFWILTNKCGNKLKHETEAEGVMTLSLVFVVKLIFMFNSQNPKSFLCMCWRRMSCSWSRRHLPRLQQGFRLGSSWKTSKYTNFHFWVFRVFYTHGLRNYLSSRSQGVVIDGVFSPWVSVTSDIPHGGHLICLMFLARLHLLPCLLMTPSVTVLFAMRKIVHHYNMTYLQCTIGLKTGVCHTIPTNVKYFESPENDEVSWICPP